MTGISGSGASPQPAQRLQSQNSVQKVRIRFENALAAERTMVSQETQTDVRAVMADLHPSGAPLPGTGRPSAQRTVPAQKVIESLNKLIQRPQVGGGSSLDIRQ